MGGWCQSWGGSRMACTHVTRGSACSRWLPVGLGAQPPAVLPEARGHGKAVFPRMEEEEVFITSGTVMRGKGRCWNLFVIAI